MTNSQTVYCTRCGTTMPLPINGRAPKYCAPCRVEVLRESSARQRARLAALRQPRPPGKFQCIRCGVEGEFTKRKPQYCADCRPIARKEKAAAAGAKWHRKHRATIPEYADLLQRRKNETIRKRQKKRTLVSVDFDHSEIALLRSLATQSGLTTTEYIRAAALDPLAKSVDKKQELMWSKIRAAEQFTADDIAQQTGAPLSTVHQYIAALARGGFITTLVAPKRSQAGSSRAVYVTIKRDIITPVVVWKTRTAIVKEGP